MKKSLREEARKRGTNYGRETRTQEQRVVERQLSGCLG